MKTKLWSMGTLVLAIAIPGSFVLSGCNGAADNNAAITSPSTHADGVTLTPGMSNGLPANFPALPPADANTITLGVKYVALIQNAADTPSPTQAEVVTLLSNMSQVWSQCNIRFQLEEYDTPVASNDGVLYNPANQSDLDADRAKYDDSKHVLYVKTGTWNRSGDLGADGSNGFSTLPPSSPEGTVFEEAVQTNTLLLSHETGHLIGGLAHTTGSTNLMNHMVSPTNTQLDQSQCDQSVAAIKASNPAWMR